MSLSSIRTYSFRNLKDVEVDLGASTVFLVGDNGQGKTNFLESIYFCSYASSFRTNKDSELIRNEEQVCSVTAKLHDSLYDSINVKMIEGKKIINCDSKKIDDRKELLLINPSIIFCHDDMEFVSGSPERRRWFFDQTISLYDYQYLEDLRRYRKILKMRNIILKEKNALMLDSIDPQLAQYGLELIKKRKEAALVFSDIFTPLYNNISGITNVSVRYVPSWKEESTDTIISYLRIKRERDILLGTTVSGPHRDKYHFIKDESEFSSKASTGQRRLLSLLLRIAQSRRYTDMTGRKPLFLLDDVLLELDPEKRRRFLNLMPEYRQAFFTFLPEEPYERYKTGDTVIYKVSEGVLSQ